MFDLIDPFFEHDWELDVPVMALCPIIDGDALVPDPLARPCSRGFLYGSRGDRGEVVILGPNGPTVRLGRSPATIAFTHELCHAPDPSVYAAAPPPSVSDWVRLCATVVAVAEADRTVAQLGRATRLTRSTAGAYADLAVRCGLTSVEQGVFRVTPAGRMFAKGADETRRYLVVGAFRGDPVLGEFVFALERTGLQPSRALIERRVASNSHATGRLFERRVAAAFEWGRWLEAGLTVTSPIFVRLAAAA